MPRPRRPLHQHSPHPIPVPFHLESLSALKRSRIRGLPTNRRQILIMFSTSVSNPTVVGSMTTSTVTFGSRVRQSAMKAGDRIPMGIGPTPIGVGPGYQTRILGGPLIIMADGQG